MPLPKTLPRTVTFAPGPSLMAQLLTLCEESDISKTRILKRALGNELDRRANKNPKLKAQLRKVSIKYGSPDAS